MKGVLVTALSLGFGLVVNEVAIRAECIALSASPQPITPPTVTITVSSAFCGNAVDITSAPLANLDLDLVDDTGRALVAKIQTDSKGSFSSRPLPAGYYRIGLLGFDRTQERIEITRSSQLSCDRPLLVTLDVSKECGGQSHITALPQSGR